MLRRRHYNNQIVVRRAGQGAIARPRPSTSDARITGSFT